MWFKQCVQYKNVEVPVYHCHIQYLIPIEVSQNVYFMESISCLLLLILCSIQLNNMFLNYDGDVFNQEYSTLRGSSGQLPLREKNSNVPGESPVSSKRKRDNKVQFTISHWQEYWMVIFL